MTSPSLWHNMSSPPSTTIECDPDYDACPFRYLLLQPAKLDDYAPARVLEALDGAPWTRSDAQARAELRRRIQDRARALPLPALVLLGDPMGSPDEYCADLLTAVAVFAKSGHGVYLRDKEPDLSRIGRWAAMLHLPKATPAIGEETAK